MQIQEFFLDNGTRKDYVFMWRALCDEREIKEKKAVMVFALFGNGRNLADSKNQIDGEVRCLIDGQSSREFTETFIFHEFKRSLLGVFCLFDRNIECPRKVSIVFGNAAVSNELKVERQYPTSEKKDHITLCSPAISTNMDSLRPSRLAEYIEYQRLIGVDKMMIGEISRENFALNEDTKRVLDFYKNIGFLETFSVQLTEKYTGYDSVSRLQRSQFTYCMVKNALVSKYIIIQDLDEIVGVNFSRYQNLQQALWKLEDKKFQFSSFFLSDTPVARNCEQNNKSNDLAQFSLFYRESFHRGKSILSSQTCQTVWAHGCLMPRTDLTTGNLSSKHLEAQSLFSKLVDLHYGNGKEALRNLHFRHRPDFREKIKLECLDDNIVEINWLQNVSETLQMNVWKVLKHLNINAHENYT
ncbi:uncharacterized protein LOC134857038 isoform X3 [Symsagittifera roscoffensis]